MKEVSLEGVRVCCLDDQETNRLLLNQYCLDWGMETSMAATPREALGLLRGASLRGKPFDLAILGFEMSGMDSLPLAQIIKQDSALAGVRLVLLTSSGRTGESFFAKTTGFSGYITKPVRKKQLHQCLERVMVLSAADQESPTRLLGTNDGVQHPVASGRARVLVADDHSVNQQIAVLMLERLGHTVDVAANGREAVEAVLRQNYDIVFMDCQMPEMDGYDATREIRKWEAGMSEELRVKGDERGSRIPDTHHSSPVTHHHIPIVAITANAIQGDREKCLAAGMDDHVSKPIRIEELTEMLAKWLPTAESVGQQLVFPNAEANPAHGGLTPAGHPDAHSPQMGPVEEGPEEPEEPEEPGRVPANEETLSSTTLTEWRTMMGEGYGPFLGKIITQFIRDATICVNEVREAIQQGDPSALAKAAHGLKGMSGNIGALRLQRTADDLERQGQEGRLPVADGVLPSLEREFSRTQEALECERLQASG